MRIVSVQCIRQHRHGGRGEGGAGRIHDLPGQRRHACDQSGNLSGAGDQAAARFHSGHASVITFIKAGRLRPLGVVFSRRLPALPDTPTMQEQGFALTAGSWQGVLVPVGTPKEIVARLYAALMKAMEQPELKKRLADGAVEIVTSASPAEFGKFIAQETQRWEKVIKEANVVAD